MTNTETTSEFLATITPERPQIDTEWIFGDTKSITLDRAILAHQRATATAQALVAAQTPRPLVDRVLDAAALISVLASHWVARTTAANVADIQALASRTTAALVAALQATDKADAEMWLDVAREWTAAVRHSAAPYRS